MFFRSFSRSSIPRYHPIAHFERLYRNERRAARARMWFNPRLLRMELRWLVQYGLQLAFNAWIAGAPGLLLWWQLARQGFDLSAEIAVVPSDCVLPYVLCATALSVLFAKLRPYTSYIDLQVQVHMNEWSRTMLQRDRGG
ncbi:hypothetical protein KEX41_29515 (plasmid) [Burkholderia thailandensis]|uniref:hypothetical protein n=1 Tax=Burkholderia thailandensis TaxID=57975 RepID=UPI00192D7749|nr:hypothetical protein [Burkholderia thailandensis]MBS2132322.1 hypothetical protein [Burkholderia thailandensis]QRA15130.1 hypothetical protein JMY07_29940 [Burkholderia thailandensis]